MLYAKKETLLKVKDVNFAYNKTQPILRDINFEIKDIVRPDVVQGQIVALIGQSGSGKSTLFNLIAGLMPPDTGTIRQGLEQKSVNIGDMGIVYQNYWVYDWRKVKSTLTMAANKNPKLPKAAIKDAVLQTAADFNLTDHLDKYPKELSGGQKQRVAIAEQLLNGSEFILLDEPFSGLDMIMIDKVRAMLQKASCVDEFKTLIIVSHDISNTVAIADTVYILAKSGKLEGSTIVSEIDLIERDLAWHPDIKEMPKFRDVLKEIKSLL